jgi:hypothetical protein
MVRVIARSLLGAVRRWPAAEDDAVMAAGPGGAAVQRSWTAESVFPGRGRTNELLRAADWAATPLGPVETWPAELRAAIRTVLPSRIPMLLW